MKARVAERGQVTIPQALRKKMGIRQGTVLEFDVQNSKLIAVKESEEDPIAEVYGCLRKSVKSTEKAMHELRGDA